MGLSHFATYSAQQWTELANAPHTRHHWHVVPADDAAVCGYEALFLVQEMNPEALAKIEENMPDELWIETHPENPDIVYLCRHL